MRTVGQADLLQQVDRTGFQHPGPDPLLDVGTGLAFQYPAVNAL
jgi:hypothetical protein